MVYLARCRRCHLHQLEEGKQEQEVVEEVYLGESSRSVVTRARQHHNDYELAMRKVAREGGSLPRVKVSRPGGEEEEEVSSWIADQTVTCHPDEVSPNMIAENDFMLISSWVKPVQHQVEEAVRIRNAMPRGFLMLDQGRRRKNMLVNNQILN